GRFVRGQAHVRRFGAGGDRRDVVQAGAAQQGIGALVVGQGDAQVVVGLQRGDDQRVQLRVLELAPERGGGGGQRGRTGLARLRVLAGQGQVRAHVVGAGDTGGQCKRKQ